MVCLDLSTEGQGRLRWRFPAQGSLGQLSGRPAIGRLGIYLADTGGMLYSIDPETGAERWRVDVGSQISTGLAAHDGRIYVPTRGGGLLCFEEGED
jgi:outer membrane protein assembly factor BamB